MLWILCSLNKEYDLAHFKQAGLKLGFELQIIDPTKLQIVADKEITFYYKGVAIKPPKYMLNWNGCMNGKLEEQVEAALLKSNVYICNNLNEINHWQDKFRMQVETDLPVAKSMKIHSSNLEESIDLIESHFTYPLILKSDTGSLGMGVYRATDRSNLKQLIEVITLLDKSFKVHIEAYIAYIDDLRMYIIGDQYYLMKREAGDDFRANIAQNGVAKAYPKSELTEKLFKEIRTKYKSLVLGVDILITKDSHYICEINSAPSFVGIEQVNDVDIAKEILSVIKNS